MCQFRLREILFTVGWRVTGCMWAYTCVTATVEGPSRFCISLLTKRGLARRPVECNGGMLPFLQQTEGVRLLVDPKDLEEATLVLSKQGSEEDDPFA